MTAARTGHRANLAERLVPIAAQLVGTVHDEGPQAVAAILARVPGGRHDALAVVLAAMVDPDARPSELLAWTTTGPVKSLTEKYGPPIPVESLGRRKERRQEVARLSALGLTAREVSERLGVSTRSVDRHRAAIRKAKESVA